MLVELGDGGERQTAGGAREQVVGRARVRRADVRRQRSDRVEVVALAVRALEQHDAVERRRRRRRLGSGAGALHLETLGLIVDRRRRVAMVTSRCAAVGGGVVTCPRFVLLNNNYRVLNFINDFVPRS